MNNYSLKNTIEKECDVIVNIIKFHESGYVTIKYKFNVLPKDIIGATERMKKRIKEVYYSQGVDLGSILRIINIDIKKNKLIGNKKISADRTIKIREEIEDLSAKEANSLSFVPRLLVIGSMPHKREIRKIINEKGEYEEIENLNHCIKDGRLSLSMHGKQGIGLPFGIKARYIFNFLAKKAVQNKSPLIELDGSLTSLMKEVGFAATGGVKGSIIPFKDQMRRLCNCFITGEIVERDHVYCENSCVISSYRTGIVLHKREEVIKDGSYIKLGNQIYNEVIKNPVPVDNRALELFRDSSLGYDVFVWTTYTQYMITVPFHVSWQLLEYKFHSNYTRKRDFKRKMSEIIKLIETIYDPGCEITKTGIRVHKTSPHVLPKCLY